ALLMVFIIYSFNRGMTEIVSTSCSHGTSCPMWGTIDFQTNMSIGITAFVALIGVYLVFFGEEEKIVTRIKRIHEQIEPRKVSRDNYRDAMTKLSNDERNLFERVVDAGGDVLQSKLVTGTGMNKVKVTRVLDRLESMGLVERRRRGMANVVTLKR
ncbi:MAG: hypothetical protein ABIA12_00125, partial [Candidatus Aenigmatarchaeota archaeon]